MAKLTSNIIILLTLILFASCGCLTETIVCNKPYIRMGAGCCLDTDDNKICDLDQTTTSVSTDTTVISSITTTTLAETIVVEVKASCSDGVKNGKEVETDCGGSCKPCTLEECKTKCETECSNKGMLMQGFSKGCDCYCIQPGQISNSNSLNTFDEDEETVRTTSRKTTTTIKYGAYTSDRIYSTVSRIRGINSITTGSIFAVRVMDENFKDHDFTIEKKSSGISVTAGNPASPDFRLYIDYESLKSLESASDLCAKMNELNSDGLVYTKTYKSSIELTSKYNSVIGCISI